MVVIMLRRERRVSGRSDFGYARTIASASARSARRFATHHPRWRYRQPDILPESCASGAGRGGARQCGHRRLGACDLPETAVVEVEGRSLYVLHDVKQLDLGPAAGGFAAVISGHSHVPMSEMRNGVLYFNPGSAGPKRFQSADFCGTAVAEFGGNQGGDGGAVRRENLEGAHPNVVLFDVRVGFLSLARKVVNQAERIFDVASRKVRLIFDDFTAILHQPALCLFDAVHRDFQNRPQRRSSFDEEVDVLAMQADHVRMLVGDLESEPLDVEKRGLLRVWRLDQNVRAKFVCHVMKSARILSRTHAGVD